MKFTKSIEIRARKAVLESICVLLERNAKKNIPKILKLSRSLCKESKSTEILNSIETYYSTLPCVKTYLENCAANIDQRILKKVILNSMLYTDDEDNSHIPFFLMLKPNYNTYPLSFNEIDKIIGNAKELGITYICIICGEPFSKNFLYDIYKKYNDMIFVPFTNGKMLSSQVCAKILELSNVIPMIFLDGLKSFTDNNYGINTFDNIVNGMKLLKTNKIPYGVFSTVFKSNLDMLTSNEFVDMLIDNGSMLSIYSMPLGKKISFNNLLTADQCKILFNKINNLRTTKPYFFIDLFNDIEYITSFLDENTPADRHTDFDTYIFTNTSSRCIKKMPLAYFKFEI